MMSEYEILKAIKFYYEMYEFSGNQDWLDDAHDMETDLDRYFD